MHSVSLLHYLAATIVMVAEAPCGSASTTSEQRRSRRRALGARRAFLHAPASFVDPKNGWQYYRIRTVGTMPLTGPARSSDNKQDGRLRKLSLRWERAAS